MPEIDEEPQMIAIGQEAPDFTLPNQDGVPLRLRELRGRMVALFAFARAGTHF